jgi:hypothetical protein
MRIKYRPSLNFVALLYLLIVGGACWLLPIPEMVKAFLALPGFLIVPYLVGRPILEISQKLLQIELNIDKISRFILSFLFGIIIITLSGLVINYFFKFNWNYFLIILIFIIALNCIKLKKNLLPFLEGSKNKNPLKLIFLVIILGIIGSFFISYFSPPPLFYGSDMFRHNHNALRLIEDGNLVFDIPYIPLFSILISTVLFLFNITGDTFTIFWAVRFLTYPLFALGTFLFVNKISNNKIISLLSSLISSFIIMGSIGLWNFTPKLLIYILFPFLLYLVNDSNLKKEFKKKDLFYLGIYLTLITSLLIFLIYKTYYIFEEFSGILLLILLILSFALIKVIYIFKESEIKQLFLISIILIFSLFFIHLSMGIITLLLLFLYLILSWICKKISISTKILILFLSLFFIIIILFLSSMAIIPTLNIYGDAPNVLPIDFQSKYNYLLENANLISFFTIFGVLFSFILMANKKIDPFPIFSIVIFILLLYSFPIIGIERILVFLTIFIAYLSSFVIYKLITFEKRKSNYKVLFIFMITLIIILTLVGNLLSHMSSLTSQPPPNNHYSHFTKEEYSIGKWVKENTEKNTLIISDTYTDAMLTGLANREKIPLLLRSHYSPEKYPQKKAILDTLNVMNSEDSYESLKKISNNIEFTCQRYYVEMESCNKEDLEIIVVFNKKTFGWIGESYPENSLNKFHDEEYFTVLYEDPINSIYIFGVNPEPGVPFETKNVPR